MIITCFIFIFYIFVRNNLVFYQRIKMIDFYHGQDPEGYNKTNVPFSEAVPSYEMMLWKFWIWSISSFYPAYHASK